MSHGRSDSAADLQRRAVRGALWTFIHLGVSLPLGFVVNLVDSSMAQAMQVCAIDLSLIHISEPTRPY